MYVILMQEKKNDASQQLHDNNNIIRGALYPYIMFCNVAGDSM